jgi:hypothetical protein
MRRGNLEPTMAPKIRVLVAMVSALTERGAHLVADARAGSPAR